MQFHGLVLALAVSALPLALASCGGDPDVQVVNPPAPSSTVVTPGSPSTVVVPDDD
jgi:hypothetical protein